jgi:hypothetical protein
LLPLVAYTSKVPEAASKVRLGKARQAASLEGSSNSRWG